MISVCTIVKGRDQQLRNLIWGLQKNFEFPQELVIVSMNEAAPKKLPVCDFEVKTVELNDETNKLPLAAARNLAAQTATSDRLVFLDVDCIPRPCHLKWMNNFLDETGGLVMGEVRYLPKQPLDRLQDLKLLEKTAEPHPRRPFVAKGGLLSTHDYHYFWSLNFGLDRSTFNKIGGFDEQFTGYGGEDTDFAFQARHQRIPFHLGGAIAYHQYHPSYQPPLQHFDDIIKNAQIFRQKWGKWCMESWLQAFAEAGYIEWEEASDKEINILKRPTEQEVQAAISE